MDIDVDLNSRCTTSHNGYLNNEDEHTLAREQIQFDTLFCRRPDIAQIER